MCADLYVCFHIVNHPSLSVLKLCYWQALFLIKIKKTNRKISNQIITYYVTRQLRQNFRKQSHSLSKLWLSCWGSSCRRYLLWKVTFFFHVSILFIIQTPVKNQWAFARKLHIFTRKEITVFMVTSVINRFNWISHCAHSWYIEWNIRR